MRDVRAGVCVGRRLAGDRERAGVRGHRRPDRAGDLRAAGCVRARAGHVPPRAAPAGRAGAIPHAVGGEPVPPGAARAPLRASGDLLSRGGGSAGRPGRADHADRRPARRLGAEPGTGLRRVSAAGNGRPGADPAGAASGPPGRADPGDRRDDDGLARPAPAPAGAALRRWRGRVHAGRVRADGVRRGTVAAGRAGARSAGRRGLSLPRPAACAWSTWPGSRWPGRPCWRAFSP